MSEQEKPPEQDPPVLEETQKPAVDPESVDVMLQTFSYMANQFGIGFGVTLNVGGLLISGTIISRQEYLTYLASSIRQGIKDSEWNEEARAFLEETFLEPLEMPVNKDKPFVLRDISYVHLKNARVFHQSGRPIPSGDDGFLWRGRINAIDGFSLGQLSYSVGNS